MSAKWFLYEKKGYVMGYTIQTVIRSKIRVYATLYDLEELEAITELQDKALVEKDRGAFEQLTVARYDILKERGAK